jgi:hypothetical protein
MGGTNTSVRSIVRVGGGAAGGGNFTTLTGGSVTKCRGKSIFALATIAASATCALITMSKALGLD